MKKPIACLLLLNLLLTIAHAQTSDRKTLDFNKDWKFYLGDNAKASKPDFKDDKWRKLTLPHDWSIEGDFDKNSPAGTGGGALNGCIGWYRKTFELSDDQVDKEIYINFDGVYRNSEVWVNGNFIGKRPNGYISFQYNISAFIKFGHQKNVIAVKVNNSPQPNSRWYSGSGIYRNVWLVSTNKIHVDNWGTYVTTPVVNKSAALVMVRTKLVFDSTLKNTPVIINTSIYDAANNEIASQVTIRHKRRGPRSLLTSPVRNHLPDEDLVKLTVSSPHLWSTEDPYLYHIKTQLKKGDTLLDEYITPFGIRRFEFDADKGFLLNGVSLKINGVCNHHDLGCLGSAVNTRALERQLEILKTMGCNGIRTSHNPPAPELLGLCDKMGFIVMDEAFDMWKKPKNPYDYHLYWDEWHKKDLTDQVLRDRNHPSVFIWSIGNEIPEQGDSTGIAIAKELAAIVRSLDATRPVTVACDRPDTANNIIKSGALDLIGYNYHHYMYPGFRELFPGKKFISTESVSALETRGKYDLFPSDSIRRWPERWDKPFDKGNADLTVSAYDHVSTPWGSTHEETWKIIKKHNFLSGQFIWTGFDYMGEPTPYPWPARSSYFGIIDMAGFPKDVYYMYQSEWTNKTVLHLLPHWNWIAGQTIDVWAYYNNADEVELFLNGKSLATQKKTGDDLHVRWRTVFEAGTLKAISRMQGKTVATTEVITAGAAAKIILTADRNELSADGKDLSFVTAKIVDAKGILVPDAADLIQFKLKGDASIVGVDNGLQTSMEKFKADKHKAFNGLCLAVIQGTEKKGTVTVTATAAGLAAGGVKIEVN